MTLEVDVEVDRLQQLIQIDWAEVEDGTAKGTIEADLEEVLLETVTGVMLSSASAPEPVPNAIEFAVADPIWRKNLERLSEKETEEMVPLDELE
ncbi:hypothetical protein PNQ20_04960 [Halobacterium salinarum]|uniref:hypothetical protein n=1 Tax=Halobacterium salinarum TaxID=2242 RepID=UPI002552B1C2|nr:hypothetical protein [Halobacterium salinarum]MDL0136205.1 hypothetical protein [Halobacterium salinarum]